MAVNAKSNIPFWGQAYQLEITYTTSTGLQTEIITRNDWEPEALRITFELLQSTLPSPWWYADIVIYNLNLPTIDNIVANAVSCRLSAGFQTGPALSSVIWDGPILQILLDTEDVVDTRVTLHCIANPIVMQNPVAFSVGQFASQARFLTGMAAQIGLPPMENSQNVATLSPFASQVLNDKQYPRGNTSFGTMGQYLDLVANDHNFATFRDGKQAFMTEIAQGDVVPPPDLVYAPPNLPNSITPSQLPPGTTQTILDVPRQFPQGVIFKVLLDPRLRVQVDPNVQVVQLVGTQIVQLPIQIDESGAITQVTQLDPDNLVYFVCQIRHVGDSRGNDWYTEVTAYSTTFAANILNSLNSSSSAA